ncbi:hypothetical protein B0H10DRAFT_1250784 [Mycena sp. CBHHK59/15]|nr:hypothetical protein B0H10DRAFT_1250784 [Mycena sp. CBHHK59/15]
MMHTLTKVTLRMTEPIPSELIGALSMIPHLTTLEFHQARLDGPPPPFDLAFSSLTSLLICICGFNGISDRASDVDRQQETDNVVVLLRAVSEKLTRLRISGDLLSTGFISLKWPRLRSFALTEHTPTPYVPVPEMISPMRALHELSILFAARKHGEPRPPFTLGIAGGDNLSNHCPHLTSITLSNLEPADPIFEQLPICLEALHIVAARDLGEPAMGGDRGDTPLSFENALTILRAIAGLDHLIELSLVLNHFPTPALLSAVATALPQLRVLELAHAWYPVGNTQPHDVRDDAFIAPLARLKRLTSLRITLDFEIREPLIAQIGPHRKAAKWLMAQLPGLCTVSFHLEQWREWQHFGLNDIDWREYDRSVLLLELPTTRPPSPLGTMIIDSMCISSATIFYR